MTCKNCGTYMPDGVKFCSNCGSVLSSENVNIGIPVTPDYDATIIADSVNSPVQPAAYANREPVIPAQSEYQTHAVPAAPRKNGVNAKLIAIIGSAVAVILAVVLVIVLVVGNKNKDKDDDKDKAESTSVENVIDTDKTETAFEKDKTENAFEKDGNKNAGVDATIKNYTNEYFSDYGNIKFTNYKSERKVSVDGAYYQLFTADVAIDGEDVGYLVGEAYVCDGSVEYYDYIEYDTDEKRDVAESINDRKSEYTDSEIKSSLNELIENVSADNYYSNYYDEYYDYDDYYDEYDEYDDYDYYYDAYDYYDYY